MLGGAVRGCVGCIRPGVAAVRHVRLLAGLTGGGWLPPALIEGVAGAPRDENSAFRRISGFRNSAFRRKYGSRNSAFRRRDAESQAGSDGSGMIESGIDLGCCGAGRTICSALSA